MSIRFFENIGRETKFARLFIFGKRFLPRIYAKQTEKINKKRFGKIIMKFLKNAAAIVVAVFMLVMPAGAEDEKKYIKWVDFLLSFSRILCVCRNTHPSLSLY